MQTAGHQSLLVGIRELYNKELCSTDSFPLITDQPYTFSSNYSLRVYSSGCYYLDEKGRWKSDGMTVNIVFFLLLPSFSLLCFFFV